MLFEFLKLRVKIPSFIVAASVSISVSFGNLNCLVKAFAMLYSFSSADIVKICPSTSLLLSFLLFLIIIIFREVALRNYTAVAGFSRFYMAKVAMCGVESAAKGSNRGRGVRGASDTVLGIFKQ